MAKYPALTEESLSSIGKTLALEVLASEAMLYHENDRYSKDQIFIKHSLSLIRHVVPSHPFQYAFYELQ